MTFLYGSLNRSLNLWLSPNEAIDMSRLSESGFRMGIGLYEVITHPFATNKGSFRPPYKSNIPWITGGYEEFPPELGNESKYPYVRKY